MLTKKVTEAEKQGSHADLDKLQQKDDAEENKEEVEEVKKEKKKHIILVNKKSRFLNVFFR